MSFREVKIIRIEGWRQRKTPPIGAKIGYQLSMAVTWETWVADVEYEATAIYLGYGLAALDEYR